MRETRATARREVYSSAVPRQELAGVGNSGPSRPGPSGVGTAPPQSAFKAGDDAKNQPKRPSDQPDEAAPYVSVYDSVDWELQDYLRKVIEANPDPERDENDFPLDVPKIEDIDFSRLNEPFDWQSELNPVECDEVQSTITDHHMELSSDIMADKPRGVDLPQPSSSTVPAVQSLEPPLQQEMVPPGDDMLPEMMEVEQSTQEVAAVPAVSLISAVSLLSTQQAPVSTAPAAAPAPIVPVPAALSMPESIPADAIMSSESLNLQVDTLDTSLGATSRRGLRPPKRFADSDDSSLVSPSLPNKQKKAEISSTVGPSATKAATSSPKAGKGIALSTKSSKSLLVKLADRKASTGSKGKKGAAVQVAGGDDDGAESDGSGLTMNDDDQDSDWQEEEDPNKLWCICQKPYSNRFMIGCDRCSEWYHGDCVGVTEAEGSKIDLYVCDVCKSGVAGPTANERLLNIVSSLPEPVANQSRDGGEATESPTLHTTNSVPHV